jgi:hypothetical protein
MVPNEVNGHVPEDAMLLDPFVLELFQQYEKRASVLLHGPKKIPSRQMESWEKDGLMVLAWSFPV